MHVVRQIHSPFTLSATVLRVLVPKKLAKSAGEIFPYHRLLHGYLPVELIPPANFLNYIDVVCASIEPAILASYLRSRHVGMWLK